MPNQKNRQTAMMAAVLGAGLLGGTMLYAEPPRAPESTDRPASGTGHIRNTDLAGGFYDDRYKLDDWYYDFYDSPGASRTQSSPIGYTSYGEPAGLADAAHPWTTGRAQHRNEHMVAYQQYYDEPWFYDRRDPVYGMPETRTDSLPTTPVTQKDNVIKGTVKATKQVRNRTTGDQNTVALVKTADGRQFTTDLGPTRRTMDMALTQGDPIWVEGQWEDVGPYAVLMAQQIKSGSNRVIIHRETGSTLADNRQVEGRIQQFRDVRTNRTAEIHRTAAVQTPDGRFAIVDLGQDSTDQTIAKATPGDRLVANGRVVQVGNYPVLLANRVSINDGTPVAVRRTDESAGLNKESGIKRPDCIGGGCDNQSLNGRHPSEPHSNAMDGTVR